MGQYLFMVFIAVGPLEDMFPLRYENGLSWLHLIEKRLANESVLNKQAVMEQVTQKKHTFKALFVYSMRPEHCNHGDHHGTQIMVLEISNLNGLNPSETT